MKKSSTAMHSNRISVSHHTSIHREREDFLSNPRVLEHLSEIRNTSKHKAALKISPPPQYRKKNYKRGENIERVYYRELTKQLMKFEKIDWKKKKLTSQQLFLYRQRYVKEFLSVFANRLVQQCEQKNVFLSRLWKNVINMFESLFERLIFEIKQNQKASLADSVNLHRAYMKKIEELSILNQENKEQLKKYDEYFQSLMRQYKEKKKKVKQLAEILSKANQNILQNENKVEILKKELIELMMNKNQNVTRSFAQNYVNDKFKLIKPDKKQMKNHLYEFKRTNRSKKRDIQGDVFSQFDVLAGPIVNLTYKNEINNESSLIPTAVAKKNYRVQVDLITKRIFQENATNISIPQRYQDSFIRNKEVQTLPVFFNEKIKTRCQGTQYQYDFSIKEEWGSFQSTDSKNEKYRLTLKNSKVYQKSYENLGSTIKRIQSSSGDDQDDIKLETIEERINTIKKEKKSKNFIKTKGRKSRNSIQTGKRKSNRIAMTTNVHLNKTENRNSVHKSINQTYQSNRNSTHHALKIKTQFTKEESQTSIPIKKKSQLKEAQRRKKYCQVQTEANLPKYDFNFYAFLTKLKKQCPVGLYLDQTITTLSNQKYRVQEKKFFYDERITKNFKFLEKEETDKRYLIRSSQNYLPVRNILKIIGKVYDRAFSFIRQKKPEPLNLFLILKQQLHQEYPSLKDEDIYNKISLLLKNFEIYSLSNFLAKNFLLISAMENKNQTQVLYSSDVEFYFKLISKLNILEAFHIQKSFTTIQCLLLVLKTYIKEHFPCEILIREVEKEVKEKLQDKIFESQSVKLDIYKCCQLILECILSYKRDYYKDICFIAQKGKINQGILKNFLDLLPIKKINYLRTVNRFNKFFGANAQILAIDFTNFCTRQGLPPFSFVIEYSKQFLFCFPQTIIDFNFIYQKKQEKMNQLAKKAYEGNVPLCKDRKSLAINDLVMRESCVVIQELLGENMLFTYVWSTFLIEKNCNKL